MVRRWRRLCDIGPAVVFPIGTKVGPADDGYEYHSRPMCQRRESNIRLNGCQVRVWEVLYAGKSQLCLTIQF